MFEKETEKHCNEAICSNCGHPREGEGNCGVVCHEWRDEYDTFKEGAEFGYNKANEWHYPSKGEYPKEYEDILICFLTEDDTRDCVYGWYEYDFENDKHIFKYINVLGTQYLKTETIIAWKEIVLPELPKESE